MTSSTGNLAPFEFCPQCGVELPAGANACPHCDAADSEGSAEQSPRDSVYKYLDRPWVMLALLFLVTAGLGLPFLWKSRAFGPAGKSVLTVIMVIYTAIILWAMYLLLAMIVEQFQELYRSW